MRDGLPPGPRWPSSLQSAAQLLVSEPWYRYVQRGWDSPVTMRLAGIGKFVLVWEPEQIRRIFAGDRDVVGVGVTADLMRRPLGPNSLLVLDGERHVQQRRLLLPPFHGEAVRAYADVVADVTAAEVARWPVGQRIALWPRMQAIALEVILRAVIGVRDDDRNARLRAVLPRVARMNRLWAAAETRFPGLADSRPGRRAPPLRARREADRLLYEEIAAHRAEPEGRDDILALLVAQQDEEGRRLDDQELRDHLLTLLLAGHETTASTLAWCFERLVRHPPALARLERELAADDGDAYLEAVVHETLRLRPVIEAVFRRLTAPYEIGGYRLPAGTNIAANIWGVHRGAAYDAPGEFRPERFLDRSPPPYAFVPFGGGPHRCLGASFAMMEMKTVLRTVLERVELAAPAARPERASRARRVSVVPTRGARVVVTRRSPRRAAPGTPRPRTRTS